MCSACKVFDQCGHDWCFMYIMFMVAGYFLVSNFTCPLRCYVLFSIASDGRCFLSLPSIYFVSWQCLSASGYHLGACFHCLSMLCCPSDWDLQTNALPQWNDHLRPPHSF